MARQQPQMDEGELASSRRARQPKFHESDRPPKRKLKCRLTTRLTSPWLILAVVLATLIALALLELWGLWIIG